VSRHLRGAGERDIGARAGAEPSGGHKTAASRVRTASADKSYDAASFTGVLQSVGVTPHVAQNTTNRRSSIDGRTTRHASFAVSQRCRKRVEKIFGSMKVIGGLRKTRYRGVERTGLWAYLVATAYNPVRMVKLQPDTRATASIDAALRRPTGSRSLPRAERFPTRHGSGCVRMDQPESPPPVAGFVRLSVRVTLSLDCSVDNRH